MNIHLTNRTEKSYNILNGGKTMMDNAYSASKARENFFSILKQVNETHEPVTVSGNSSEKEAVIISLKDFNAMQETMALIQNSQLIDALNRENSGEGYTEVEKINWDEY